MQALQENSAGMGGIREPSTYAERVNRSNVLMIYAKKQKIAQVYVVAF